MDPHFADLEIVRRWTEGTLPDRFTAVPGGATLVPLVRPGVSVLVERRGFARGDLVCVVARERLYWRRVLALRGSTARVRGEHVPFEDGWTEAIVGRVLLDHPLHRIAQVSPGLWCTAQWEALLARSRLEARLHRPAAPTETFTVRRLGPDDAEAFRNFYATAWGAQTPVELSPGALTWGLFTSTGQLVGSTRLDVSADGTARSGSTVVAARYRGRGGGALLLQEKMREARTLGMTRVVTQVRATNAASLRMVRGAGFRTTGRWAGRDEDPASAADRALVELEWTP